MLYYDHNDETLVLLTLAGDQNAYEMLVSKYERSVLTSALSVTKNSFLAEDAAQDAFVTAWMKLDRLKDPSKYGSWVCRIAKNCAKNLLLRYKSYIDITDVCDIAADGTEPELIYAESEGKELLQKGISSLSERIALIIRLHYFEGLSVLEIAQRLGVAQGTVKSQLAQGRRKLRKELCAMNEEINDTLVKRVMKKVEELKSWKSKNSKRGFERVYKEVLDQVEELPESVDKYHALADVLMHGWWWLQKGKNDALFCRIKESAELGKNEEVLSFVYEREAKKLYGEKRYEYIREVQIPKLEKEGYIRALGGMWMMLATEYLFDFRLDEGLEACERALSILPCDDPGFALAKHSIMQFGSLKDEYKDKSQKSFHLSSSVTEFRYEGGRLRRCDYRSNTSGNLLSVDRQIDYIFTNASSCDGYLTFPDIKPGESVTASDGEKYTYESDNEVVVTPAGIFEGCVKWSAKRRERPYVTYFKEGIGIVKQESRYDGVCEERLLCSYEIKGGKGLVPFSPGNRWEYCAGYDESVIRHNNEITVAYADEGKVILAQDHRIERLRYNDDSWLDMIEQVRNEYFKDGKVCDVYYPIERAEALALTPVQRAHTKAMASVAKRILDTDPEFNPGFTESGHWNFFERMRAEKKNGRVSYEGDFRWSFQLKKTDGTYYQYPVTNNDIYGILKDAVGCIWDDEWRDGAVLSYEDLIYGQSPIITDITCSNADEITTKAGSFKNCLRVSLDIKGIDETGLNYRGGKKEFFFAEGIGLVLFTAVGMDEVAKAHYELTAYNGVGKGYMPIEDGMMRHYDALGLIDGYIASAEYTYCRDDEGNMVIFEDRKGTRSLPDNYTTYDTVHGETLEEDLWIDEKLEESRLRHDINNFHLLCHFFGRNSRYWAVPKKAVAWNKYRMQIMETLNGDKSVPKAWIGHYWTTCFRTACALFGCGEREEGYKYLEKAFELYPEWQSIKVGEEMEVGNELIFGGIKAVKDKHYIVLPDGTREPHYYPYLFEDDGDLMVYGMTAPQGWEWFDPVRNEELFKEYIERARKMQKENK